MPATRTALLWACVALVGAEETAFAQSPAPVEVSGGYQYVLDLNDDGDLTHIKQGLFASAAWNATRRLAIVGEFSRSAMTIDVGTSSRFGPIDQTLYTTMGGVRVWFGGMFVQTLLGQFAVRTHRELLLGTEDATVTELVVQPGVGFDVVRVGRVAARVLGDYRWLLSDDTRFKQQFRLGVGATVGLGRR